MGVAGAGRRGMWQRGGVLRPRPHPLRRRHARAAPPTLPRGHPAPRPGARVVYTYDVYWDTSNITWSSRWDAYLRMPGGKVHWFSILNSLMVVVRRGSVARVCDQGGSGRQDGGAWRPPWLPPPALKATAVLACHPRCRAAPATHPHLARLS